MDLLLLEFNDGLPLDDITIDLSYADDLILMSYQYEQCNRLLTKAVGFFNIGLSVNVADKSIAVMVRTLSVKRSSTQQTTGGTGMRRDLHLEKPDI